MKISFNKAPKDRRAIFFFIIALVFFFLSAPSHANQLDLLDENIESWHFENAHKILTDLTGEQKVTPRARYLAGKLLFFQGKYADALPEFRQAIEGARAEIGWKILRDRAQKSQQVFSKLTKISAGNCQTPIAVRKTPSN